MFSQKSFIIENDLHDDIKIKSSIEQNGGTILTQGNCDIIISHDKKRDGKTVDSNYITTCLNNRKFIEPITYQKLIKLSTREVHTWTSQQLASFLVFNGFSIERAQLFYNAQYTGAHVEFIFHNPKENYSDNIPKVVWITFTYWIQQTFFRFWSKEQTELMLKHGMELSDMEYKNHYSELSGKEIGQIVDSEIVEDRYRPLKDWILNTRNEEVNIPLLSFRLITKISTITDYSNSIPYQNNKICVMNMGNALLHNLVAKETGLKYLVCNFAYFGYGKTRIGVEFQKLFRNALSDTETIYIRNKTYLEYLSEEFSNEQIESLQNANMVNMMDYSINSITELDNIIVSNIVKRFNVPPPPDSMNIKEWITTIGPIYIILDEFQVLISNNQTNNQIYQQYLEIWNEQIIPLQESSNVFLYICGKGILFEMVSKCFEQTLNPTLVHSVQLSPIKLLGIQQILLWLKVNSDIIPQLSEYLLLKTGGIPFLIHFAIMNSGIQLVSNWEETKLRVDSNLERIPIQFSKPFSNITVSKGLAKIYKILIWSSILKKIYFTTQVKIVNYLSNFSEFEGIDKIDIVQLSLYCNNYIEEVISDDGTDCNVVKGFRIVLPEIIIENYLNEQNHVDISFIYRISKLYPNLVESGDLLENMIALKCAFQLSCLNNENTTSEVGTLIPFLCNTPLEKEIVQIPQIILNSFGKVSKVQTFQQHIHRTNSEQFNTWPEIIKHLKCHPLQLFKFKDGSFSPDSIMYISNSQNVEYFLCFQEHNESAEIEFSSLKNEVCKTIPLLESCNSEAVIILVIVARLECNALSSGVYTNEKIQYTKHEGNAESISEMKIPKKFYLVIPSTRELNEFIGKLNVKALNNISLFKEEFISISNALEFVEENELPNKKQKL